MKLAMFGGSFDPIHNGHVQLAEAFTEKLGIDRTLIVPTFIPPHKQKKTTVTPQQRLDMCRLAFSDRDDVEVSDIEIKRQGASYTYLTLLSLKEMYKGCELYLITGADMFMTIHQWKHPEIIFESAVICGVPRNDDDISDLKKQQEYLSELGAKSEILDAGIMTVSSTEIREKISRGESISALVPGAVEVYIRENKLYMEAI